MRSKRLILVICGYCVGVSAEGQVAVPEEKRLHAYALLSGVHDGAGGQPRAAYTGAVMIPGAASMRIVFDDWKLGEGSRVLVRSLEDDAIQRLDRAALAEWNVHCQPPWSSEELLDKLRRAARYGREPVGGLL